MTTPCGSKVPHPNASTHRALLPRPLPSHWSMCVCTCACVCTCMYLCACVCMCVCAHVRACLCVCDCMCVCMCVCVCVCVRARAHLPTVCNRAYIDIHVMSHKASSQCPLACSHRHAFCSDALLGLLMPCLARPLPCRLPADSLATVQPQLTSTHTHTHTHTHTQEHVHTHTCERTLRHTYNCVQDMHTHTTHTWVCTACAAVPRGSPPAGSCPVSHHRRSTLQRLPPPAMPLCQHKWRSQAVLI